MKAAAGREGQNDHWFLGSSSAGTYVSNFDSQADQNYSRRQRVMARTFQGRGN